jgi:hypothetical protein
MSAWPVPDKDIDLLAHWICGLGLTTRSKTSVGRELRGENYKSLRARYGWYADEYRKAPAYHFTMPKVNEAKGYDPFDQDQALKTVHFYDYQSCEHGERYRMSQSYRWIKRLEKYLETNGADWQRKGLLWGVYA